LFSIGLETEPTKPWESTVSNPEPAGVAAQRPADAESLHLFLFDDVKSEEAAATPSPADASEPISFDSLSPWPANVASPALAEKLLKGAEAPELLRPSIKRVQETLSPLERAALYGEAVPFDSAPLRDAVLVRWRLTAAIELQPAAEAEAEPAAAEPEPRRPRVDLAALEQLLTDADVALAALRAPDQAVEELKAGFSAARGTLAKEAVRLAEVSRALAHQ